MIPKMEPKPNFTGDWVFQPAKSKLDMRPAPDATTFRIRHEEPYFQVARTHVYGKRSETWSADLTTDGREHRQISGDLFARMRLRWDGRALVFDVKLRKGAEEGTDLVRYTLSEDGRTFFAHERLDSETLHWENLWVFERE